MNDWEKVSGHKCLHVSCNGEVKTTAQIDSNGHRHKGKLLKQRMMENGYMVVDVKMDSDFRYRPVLVHRLVCAAFHGPPPSEDSETRHLNGLRSDNCQSNLTWGTTQDNANDRIKHGTVPRGSGHHNAKLDERDVARILSGAMNGEPRSALAKKFGVSKSNIDSIVWRKTFRHVALPIERRIKSPLDL